MSVLYEISSSPLAEDTGRGWSWVGEPPVAVQTGSLVLELIGDLRDVFVTNNSTVIVLPEIADAIQADAAGVVLRNVEVRGQQPRQIRLPDMVQISSVLEVSLIDRCVLRRPGGGVRLVEPLVLKSQEVAGKAGTFVVEQNRNITLFSEQTKELLLRYRADLTFVAVPFENEVGSEFA